MHLKYFSVLPLFVFITLHPYAEDIACAVPVHIKPLVEDLFQKEIEYTRQKVILIPFEDNKAVIFSLQNPKIKFAIVRSDILLRLQKEKLQWKKAKDYYITLSSLPFTSQLYLIQDKNSYDSDFDTLEGKRISVGSLGDDQGYLLKSILSPPRSKYQLNYKSLPLEKSLQQIQRGTIDAYFGFLPNILESDRFNFQSTFSSQDIAKLKKYTPLNIRYFGALVSYVLIANINTNDKALESLIYRLVERNIFTPLTDKRYGHINRYVVQHLAQIQMVLNSKKITMQAHVPQENNIASKRCLSYHYGFLKLLRQKPSLKKKIRIIRLRRPSQYKKAKSYLQHIESILISIDAHKKSCDMYLLKQKTASFKLAEQGIHALSR